MVKKTAVRKVYERVIIYMDYLACALTVFLCGWILVDVFGRFFFNSPVPGTAELASNVITGILFLEIPCVEMRHNLTKSDLLSSRLPFPGQIIVDTVSCLMGIVVFGLGLKVCWEGMMHAWKIGEYDGEGSIHIPTYIFKTIVVIGIIFVLIQLVINIRDYIANIRRGKDNQLPEGEAQIADSLGAIDEAEQPEGGDG